MMYVILKGSVNVLIKQRDSAGNFEQHLVATLYDGKAFGDLALI